MPWFFIASFVFVVFICVAAIIAFRARENTIEECGNLMIEIRELQNVLHDLEMKRIQLKSSISTSNNRFNCK